MSDSVVYYIRRGSHIKIGRTVRFRARMSALRPDEVLAVEPGGHEVETARHRQFKAHHIAGHPDGVEWFRLGDDLLAHIAGVAAEYGTPEQLVFPPKRPYKPRKASKEDWPATPGRTITADEIADRILRLNTFTRDDITDRSDALAWLVATMIAPDLAHIVIGELYRRGETLEKVGEKLGVSGATASKMARPPGPDRRRRKGAQPYYLQRADVTLAFCRRIGVEPPAEVRDRLATSPEGAPR